MEQVHVVAAIVAVIIGAAQAYRRKRGVAHRWLGWTWVVAMVTVALSSFFLHSITGGLSFLHGLSVFVLFSLTMGIVSARQGLFAAHGLYMINTWGGLVTAGWLAAARHGLDVHIAVHAVVISVFWALLTRLTLPLYRQTRRDRRRARNRNALSGVARHGEAGIFRG